MFASRKYGDALTTNNGYMTNTELNVSKLHLPIEGLCVVGGGGETEG